MLNLKQSEDQPTDIEAALDCLHRRLVALGNSPTQQLAEAHMTAFIATADCLSDIRCIRPAAALALLHRARDVHRARIIHLAQEGRT